MQLPTLTFALLIGIASAAPISEENSEKIIVTKDLFPESLVVYSGEHEIVNLLVPLNGLNYREDTEDNRKVVLFFVEADEDESGKRVDRGLYVLKDGVPKKLLDHGRDAAAANEDNKDVFFATHDGIYIYDDETNTAEKYGAVTDSIIGIAKETGTDVIYILTEDHELYKVTEAGMKKEKIEDVVGAEQIVLDYKNNLYFLGEDKQPYVYNAYGVKKIEGTPEHALKAQLIKPPLYSEAAIPFIADSKTYVIYADGSSEPFNLEFTEGTQPSAYAMEAALMQYYALDKKIYEFDILDIMIGGIYDTINEILNTYIAIIEGILTLGIFNFN